MILHRGGRDEGGRLLGAVSNIACFFFAFYETVHRDIDIQGERGDKLHGRGTRKTHPSNNIAMAVSTGEQFGSPHTTSCTETMAPRR